MDSSGSQTKDSVAFDSDHIEFIVMITNKKHLSPKAVNSADMDIAHPDHQSSADEIPEGFIHFCEHFLLPHADTQRKPGFTMEERAETRKREVHSKSDEALSHCWCCTANLMPGMRCMKKKHGTHNWWRIENELTVP